MRDRYVELGMTKLAEDLDLTDEEWNRQDNYNVMGSTLLGSGAGAIAGANLAGEPAGIIPGLLTGGLLGSAWGKATSAPKIERMVRKAKGGDKDALRSVNHLKKTADQDEKDEHAGKKGLAGLIGGGAALRKSTPKITGRERLYHGTHPDNYKKILKDGVKAKFTGQKGSNTEVLKEVNPEAFKKSLGKSFAAKDYGTAKGYAWQSRLGGINNLLEGNYEKISLNPFKKDTVKINAPLRKMKTTGNPEIGGLSFKEWKEKLKETKPNEVRAMRNSQLKSAYKSLKDKTVTFEGDIPTKYIKGSDNYKRVGLSEIKDFAKNNPKKFTGGAALAGLGAAGAGYGVKKLYDKWQSRKEDD